MKSILSKKEERISTAILSYNKFVKTFPESDKIKELEGMAKKLQDELMETKEQFATISENN